MDLKNRDLRNSMITIVSRVKDLSIDYDGDGLEVFGYALMGGAKLPQLQELARGPDAVLIKLINDCKAYRERMGFPVIKRRSREGIVGGDSDSGLNSRGGSGPDPAGSLHLAAKLGGVATGWPGSAAERCSGEVGTSGRE